MQERQCLTSTSKGILLLSNKFGPLIDCVTGQEEKNYLSHENGKCFFSCAHLTDNCRLFFHQSNPQMGS
jgi:hypothetical protein